MLALDHCISVSRELSRRNVERKHRRAAFDELDSFAVSGARPQRAGGGVTPRDQLARLAGRVEGGEAILCDDELCPKGVHKRRGRDCFFVDGRRVRRIPNPAAGKTSGVVSKVIVPPAVRQTRLAISKGNVADKACRHGGRWRWGWGRRHRVHQWGLEA